jgi:hypothetical protein
MHAGCFQALSGDAQRFFIHLYQRKGDYLIFILYFLTIGSFVGENVVP